MHPLDRPVWASLTTRHAQLALGNGLAKRYPPDVNRFASACDDGPEAAQALAALIEPGDPVYILQAADIRIPDGVTVTRAERCVQMVAQAPLHVAADVSPHIAPLGPDDAEEMLALATLTKPGPFLPHTQAMGRFFGIRVDGRLAAMAGERFHFPGYAEVSGVCTHPDFRGHGYAHRLSRYVAADIAARGETAFLHSWTTNTAAIALYAALGFRLRGEVNVAVLEKGDPARA